MPRTTARHPFEFKMLQAVVRRIGDHTLRALAVPGEEFATSSIQDRRLSELHEALPAHVFYDPFEPFEYRWLSWSGLTREHAEAWLGVQFSEADFGEVKAFPETWGVMF